MNIYNDDMNIHQFCQCPVLTINVSPCLLFVVHTSIRCSQLVSCTCTLINQLINQSITIIIIISIKHSTVQAPTEEDDFAYTLRSVAWELIPLFGPLSRRGLNPVKPVYDPDRPDGRLNLTVSTFNQLGRYTSSPGRRGYCYAELAVFFPSGGHNHRQ